MPDIVTHTYHPDPGPFRNLCALDDKDAEAVLARLRTEFGRCRSPLYLRQRRETEAWLRASAIAKGIPASQTFPIYFFLGEYDDGRDPARPAAITVPLSAFPVETVTFTYRDSMDCVDAPAPYDRVFTLPEMEEFIAEVGMPCDGPVSDPIKLHRRAFVEMQLWDDAPLAAQFPTGLKSSRTSNAALPANQRERINRASGRHL